MSARFIKAPLLGVVLAATLMAQTPPAVPQGTKLGPVTMSGSFRSRLESWDWFQGDADNAYAYSGSLLRLSFSQKVSTVVDWQLELALPLLLGLPDGAVAPGAQGQLGLGANYFLANDRSRNAAGLFIKQSFVRFKRSRGNAAHSLRLGRMEFVDGTEVVPKNSTLAAVKRDRVAHRLIGNFAFSHVQRSFDGVHYSYDRPTTNITLLGARPTRGVFQVDGWGELDVAVFYGALTHELKWKKSAGELRVFGLMYDDWRSVLKTDNRPLAARRADTRNITITMFGGHYIHTFDTAAGQFDALFWAALQTGTWGVLGHRASAISVEAGYQPPALPALRPWIRAGFHHGTGDGNPDDGTHNTFFQVLPTGRWLARFPFYNLMNNQDAYAQLILRPHAKVLLRSEAHALRLADRNDLWYQGGGAFQPWTFGYVGRPGGGNRGLANVFDLSADFQISSQCSVVGYFAKALGKGVPASIYPNGKNASLGFLEITYRF